MRLTHRECSRSQRGVAAVEFCIVVPLCLFLFLAVSEFGRAILQYNTLTRAVRDGVRYVADNATAGQSQIVTLTGPVIAEASNLVAYGNTGATGPTLLPGLAPGNVTVANEGGGVISLTATYDYQPMLGAILPDLLGTGGQNTAFTMRAQVTMRAL